MKFFIIIIFTILSSSLYSQEETSFSIERAKFEAKKDNQNITLTFNLGGLSKNQQGHIKDEILNYKKKIISLILNEKTEVMTLTFLNILPEEKIYYILTKYGYKNSSTESNE